MALRAGAGAPRRWAQPSMTSLRSVPN